MVVADGLAPGHLQPSNQGQVPPGDNGLKDFD